MRVEPRSLRFPEALRGSRGASLPAGGARGNTHTQATYALFALRFTQIVRQAAEPDVVESGKIV